MALDWLCHALWFEYVRNWWISFYRLLWRPLVADVAELLSFPLLNGLSHCPVSQLPVVPVQYA